MTAQSTGGPAKRVKVLTDADLKANGGAYTLLGQKPVRVYGVTDAETKAQGGQYAVEGNIAMPVYVVDAPDGAIEGTVAPVPMIAVEGVAAGNVALPVYVVAGSLPGGGGNPPDTPANFALAPAGAGRDDVLASWDAVAGADGYILEYDDGGGYDQIADTTDTDYTHTAPTLGNASHPYRVRAYNGAGSSANATASISGLALGEVLSLTGNAITDDTGRHTPVVLGTVTFTDGAYVVSSGNRIEIPASADFAAGGNAYSLVCMAYQTSSADGYVYGKHGQDMNINFNPTDGIGFWASSFNAHGQTGVGPSLNTWYHVAVTSDGTTYRLYVNGAEVDTDPVPGSPLDTLSTLIVGARQTSGSNPFTGRIKNISWYNRALSAAQVTASYNGGAGNPYPHT